MVRSGKDGGQVMGRICYMIEDGVENGTKEAE